MARYIEPVCRVCRHLGDKLLLKGNKCIAHCTFEKRSAPPGPHRQRRKRSDRGLQLMEKQKARYTYGVLERQFKILFAEAEKRQGITADNLIVLLERRLDNAVYRLGFAGSRPQARQIVQHGHIMLNGRKTSSPSCRVKEGDTISWREGSTKTEYYKILVEAIKAKSIPVWLSLEKETLVGRVLSLPTPEESGAKFEGKAIVEYYSR